ncbi:MAG: CRISPR-associated endonuclease Cas2, partial [Candidatus Abyssobacteria bacterium SURF_17]
MRHGERSAPVSYDVSNNKKRSKIADILKDYGHRVQYSVFEC